jgi:hypothetical protein
VSKSRLTNSHSEQIHTKRSLDGIDTVAEAEHNGALQETTLQILQLRRSMAGKISVSNYLICNALKLKVLNYAYSGCSSSGRVLILDLQTRA